MISNSAFLSISLGLLGNLIADRMFSNLSWQSLEPVIALFVSWATLAAALRSYFQRERERKTKTSLQREKERLQRVRKRLQRERKTKISDDNDEEDKDG